MARIRSDKPEAYQSETLAEISLAAERTFKGMATIADDRGRLADKPAQINGELWSMRGSHATDDLEAELAEMLKVDLVCRYTGCNGKRYLHLVRWDQHQKIDRPSKSRIPRCPVHQAKDDCLHEDACIPPEIPPDSPESSRGSREDSRGLQPDQNGLDAVADADGRVLQGELVADAFHRGQADSRHASDLGERESSRESRESSMQDLGSRTVDLGSRTVDLGSVPPTAGTAKPRRKLSPDEVTERTRHVGEIVASFVDGATESGLKAPPASLRARVGKQAKDLLAEDWDIDFLINSARRMGAGEFNDLATQVRKDDVATARANGHGPPGAAGQSTGAQRAQAALEAGRRVQAMLDERNAS